VDRGLRPAAALACCLHDHCRPCEVIEAERTTASFWHLPCEVTSLLLDGARDQGLVLLAGIIRKWIDVDSDLRRVGLSARRQQVLGFCTPERRTGTDGAFFGEQELSFPIEELVAVGVPDPARRAVDGHCPRDRKSTRLDS